MYYMSDELSCN